MHVEIIQRTNCVDSDTSVTDCATSEHFQLLHHISGTVYLSMSPLHPYYQSSENA